MFAHIVIRWWFERSPFVVVRLALHRFISPIILQEESKKKPICHTKQRQPGFRCSPTYDTSRRYTYPTRRPRRSCSTRDRSTSWSDFDRSYTHSWRCRRETATCVGPSGPRPDTCSRRSSHSPNPRNRPRLATSDSLKCKLILDPGDRSEMTILIALK